MANLQEDGGVMLCTLTFKPLYCTGRG